MRANEKIETGICVSLELIIKECDKPIVGTGIVRYSKETKECDAGVFRLGIEFIDIDKKIIRFVISYIHGKTHAEVRKKSIKMDHR